MSTIVSRRTLLKGSGALIVSFALPPPFGRTAAADGAKPVDLNAVESFLALGADGEVTVYSGKVDLGTGVRTALAQIVADELYVSFSKVTLVQGDTDLTPDQGVTYGSLSVQNGGAQLRRAAATARRALLQEAGKRFDAPPDSLRIEDGIVVGPNGKSWPLHTLIGPHGIRLAMDKTAPLKAPEDFKYVGHSVPRVDIRGQGDRSLHVHARLQDPGHVSRPRGSAPGHGRLDRERR